MPQGKKRLERSVKVALAQKQDKPKLVPALLGAYVNGQKTLPVAARRDFVWCRIRGATSEVVQAFNDTVGEHFDLPVLIYRDPNHEGLWRVYGRDISQYEDWEGVSYLPSHGSTHSFVGGVGSGNDPVWVYKRQFMPLLPRPVVSGTMGVFVEQDIYFWDGSYRWWPGSGTQDLSSYKPTGTSTGKFLTVYIRGSDKTLQILEGDEFPLIYASTNPLEYIEVPTPDEGIPIAAVILQTGTTRIGWHEIYDLRLTPAMFPQTGSNVGVYDEHVFQGGISNIDFVGDDITAVVSGSYAFVQVDVPDFPPFPQELIGFYALDDGIPLGTGVRLDFGDNLTVLFSGTSVRIDAPAGGGGGGGGGGVVVWDDGEFLATGTIFDFGDNLTVSASGSVVRVDAAAAAAGAIDVFQNGLLVLDDASELDFTGPGVDTAVSGSRAQVDIGPELYEVGNPGTGTTWVNFTIRVYVFKPFTITQPGYLMSIGAFVQNTGGAVGSLSGGLWADDPGTPGQPGPLIAIGANNDRVDSLFMLSGFGGRWLHFPIGRWLEPGTYYMGFGSHDVGTTFQIRFEAGAAGSGFTDNFGWDYIRDRNSPASTTNNYSIKGQMLLGRSL